MRAHFHKREAHSRSCVVRGGDGGGPGDPPAHLARSAVRFIRGQRPLIAQAGVRSVDGDMLEHVDQLRLRQQQDPRCRQLRDHRAELADAARCWGWPPEPTERRPAPPAPSPRGEQLTRSRAGAQLAECSWPTADRRHIWRSRRWSSSDGSTYRCGARIRAEVPGLMTMPTGVGTTQPSRLALS